MVLLGPYPRQICDPEISIHDCTYPHPGSRAPRFAGGVGTQSPGRPAPGAVYANCAVAAPSLDRIAMISSATIAPNAILGSEAEIACADSDAASAAASAADCDGYSVVSARWAAPAAAASADPFEGGKVTSPYIA